jgi:hypothetical protein
MLRRKRKKTQFVKQERNMQNANRNCAFELFKGIAPQQLMLGTQVFTKKF